MAVKATLDHYTVNRSHIYVVGLSAGGVMADVMASCYPDIFAGAAIHSGVEYANPMMPTDPNNITIKCPTVSSEISGNFAYACSGLQPHHLPKVIIFHGDADTRVYPCNSEGIFGQWVQMEDWADDHILNGSISAAQATTKQESPPGKYSYVERDLVSRSSGWSIRQIRIHGLAHAWSGGVSSYFASDPNGPDATSLLWNFFTGR